MDHLCYMRLLKDVLPSGGEKVLCLFYDIETTQNTRHTDEAQLHVTNLVSLQQYCSRCEDEENVGDCVRCGRCRNYVILMRQ